MASKSRCCTSAPGPGPKRANLCSAVTRFTLSSSWKLDLQIDRRLGRSAVDKFRLSKNCHCTGWRAFLSRHLNLSISWITWMQSLTRSDLWLGSKGATKTLHRKPRSNPNKKMRPIEPTHTTGTGIKSITTWRMLQYTICLHRSASTKWRNSMQTKCKEKQLMNPCQSMSIAKWKKTDKREVQWTGPGGLSHGCFASSTWQTSTWLSACCHHSRDPGQLNRLHRPSQKHVQ